MTGDRPDLSELMADAHRVMLMLDDVTVRGSPRALAVAVSDGKRVFAQMRDYRGIERMSERENVLLQAAIDFLRSRLRSFGEQV
jgi:hypothetical protein